MPCSGLEEKVEDSIVLKYQGNYFLLFLVRPDILIVDLRDFFFRFRVGGGGGGEKNK